MVYLYIFNNVSFTGWCIILLLFINDVLKVIRPSINEWISIGDCEFGWWGFSCVNTGENFWSRYSHVINFVQFLAVLELYHSFRGIVKSPFLTTFLQVLSRFIVLFLCTNLSTDSQGHPSLPLMLISWSLAEIPRYTFYGMKLSLVVPGWLKWIRYSGFLVLYPTGIIGELMQLYVGLRQAGMRWLFLLVIALYTPGSYVMYTHMLKQRKKCLEK